MAKGKTLGEYIEKWHVKKADWQGEHELEVLGVSNVDGITTTSHVKSEDLSGYLVIEPKTFAYNPYRINVGSVGLTPNNIFGVVSPAYVVFKVREGKLIPELLLEYLKSFDGLQQINKYARGTVRKALRFDDLCKIEVNFPEYNEQKNIFEKKLIVEKKSDELETEIQTQKQLLTQLKQSILQEAIQGKLTEDWRKQNPDTEPANELLKRIEAEKAQLIKDKKIKKEKVLPLIKEEEIPFVLPKGWVWCRLQDITALITDGKHGNCVDQQNSGYYFLSAKDIQNGKLLYENARQINQKEFNEVHNRTDLEPGDLCIVNTGGTVGKMAIATKNELTRKTTFQKSVAVVKPFKPYILSEYLSVFIVIETPNLLKTSRGSAINNLLLGDMKKVCVPLPPFEEQKAIVEKVETLMRKCDGLEQEIKSSEANAQMFMQAVLKEAFEGEKEVVEV